MLLIHKHKPNHKFSLFENKLSKIVNSDHDYLDKGVKIAIFISKTVLFYMSKIQLLDFMSLKDSNSDLQYFFILM